MRHPTCSDTRQHRRSWAKIAALGFVVAIVIVISATGRPAAATMAAVGKPAPAFSGTDTGGRTISLADLAGRVVVLEWSNHECPFVGRHYGSGHVQALQAEATRDGVTWLTILSSAPGEQGYVTAAEADRLSASRGAMPTAVVLDPDGTIGRAYGAKTTPHMYVIDAAGILVYTGAIDDQPRNFGANPAEARNYVAEALAAVKSGTPVPVPVTQPYGCSVKYKG